MLHSSSFLFAFVCFEKMSKPQKITTTSGSSGHGKVWQEWEYAVLRAHPHLKDDDLQKHLPGRTVPAINIKRKDS